MNNKEFLVTMSGKTGLSQEETQQKINCLLAVMDDIWLNNDSVSVSGFGVLEIKKRMERVSVSPKTGQRMLIPPKLVISYKPSALLKEKIK